jgi:hypothetical protein
MRSNRPRWARPAARFVAPVRERPAARLRDGHCGNRERSRGGLPPGGDSPRSTGEHDGRSRRSAAWETDHAARTAEHGDAVAAAEMPVAMDAPSLVPSIESPAHPDAVSDQDEIETFAARRKRLQARRKQASKSSRWTALVLVLFAFNVALVGARSEVVRFFPQTASLFAAVGLPGQSAQPEI